MFDVGASEFLLVVIVAIVVIGPKDLPLALRTAGRWIGKIRRVSGHFRAGIETMIREAELEEMERKWREQNAAILAGQPPVQPEADAPLPVTAQPRPEAESQPEAAAQAVTGRAEEWFAQAGPAPQPDPEQRPLPLQPPA